jgi:chromosome segregation ATPase
MANEDGRMGIPRPRLGLFEINLNTVVVLLGFAAGLITWGYTLSEFRTGQATNAKSITDIETRVGATEASTRATLRQLDNHELRITEMEKQMSDAAGSMKEVQKTLNDLTSDTRVMKEILQRIEAAQSGGDARRRMHFP